MKILRLLVNRLWLTVDICRVHSCLVTFCGFQFCNDASTKMSPEIGLLAVESVPDIF